MPDPSVSILAVRCGKPLRLSAKVGSWLAAALATFSQSVLSMHPGKLGSVTRRMRWEAVRHIGSSIDRAAGNRRVPPKGNAPHRSVDAKLTRCSNRGSCGFGVDA